ncbi:response regulator transcription factor [Paenibacillus albus]|uniref:Response regulator transcription factor n=1 Tax=Paenibacillus albus TaxID=2495582 RepID=A0A3S9A0F9_9BACL|nr:response regulator transcription factor [Paenibacillus albus]AZN39165.1 response regulator transcription factor [Paenibacillus albus]
MKPVVILVIDDDPDIQHLMTAFLSHEGYVVRNALRAKAALELLTIEEPDLIIMDVQMPDMDGITLCNQIRKQYHRPILFVSGAQNQDYRMLALKSGGDDYISKPFDPEELVLRVKANLRWSHLLARTPAAETQETRLEFPGLSIDLERMTVMVNHKPVTLPFKEFQLLVVLAKKPNQVFHPQQLYRQVWDDEANYSKDTVKTHISNLRRKIEPVPSLPSFILTSGQLGYRFNPYGAAQTAATSE